MIPALYGGWTAWVIVRLVASAGWIEFPLSPPADGIRTYSYKVGYPKAQDFFWYALTTVAGIAGALIAGWLARSLARRGALRERRWAPIVGVAFLTVATLLLFSHRFAGSAITWLLALLGALLPWFDRHWIRRADDHDGPGTNQAALPPKTFFPYRLMSIPSVLILLVSFLAVADPCLRFRGVDGHHEGNMLLYAVHAQHGEIPGLDYRPEYGPLFLHTFTGWMKAAGMVVASERRYFATAQWLGAVLHLLAIGWLCRSASSRIAGSWLMLTLTTAPFVQYGWANGLRTALPLFGFALAWRATAAPAMIIAGATAAVGWWYSQEFGSAAIAGTLIMLLLRRDVTWRGRSGWLSGVAAAGGVVLPLALYGTRVLEVFASPPGGGMLLSKLSGSGSVPFPPFFGWDAGMQTLRKFWWNDMLNLLLWLPALLAGPAAAVVQSGGGPVKGRGPMIAGLAALALLYQWPAVVRPIDQIRMSAPGAIALAAVLFDRPGLRRAWLTAGLLGASLTYGGLHLLGIKDSLLDRAFCLRVSATYPAVKLSRLGEIWIPAEEEQRTTALVETIQRLCPPDGRVYSGAAYDTHVLFLADRMAVSPYPVPFVAQTGTRRAEVVRSLEHWQPAVALIHRRGIDLPWEQDRSEEWDWIRPRYRRHSVFGDVEVWVRK